MLLTVCDFLIFLKWVPTDAEVHVHRGSYIFWQCLLSDVFYVHKGALGSLRGYKSYCTALFLKTTGLYQGDHMSTYSYPVLLNKLTCGRVREILMFAQ